MLVDYEVSFINYKVSFIKLQSFLQNYEEKFINYEVLEHTNMKITSLSLVFQNVGLLCLNFVKNG